MSATIRDVAKQAGVSITTVSRVLNQPTLVNEKTKDRVLETIRRINYEPNLIARVLKGKSTRTIGVVVPDFMNLYYAEFISHVETRSRSLGFQAMVVSSNKDSDRGIEYANELVKRNIDGLLLSWYKETVDRKDFLYNLGCRIPVVIDQPPCGLPVSAAYSDAYAGIRKLVNYLISCGYSKIAIIKSPDEYRVAAKRFQAYLDSLEENNQRVDRNLIEECDFTAESAFRACNRLLARVTPTAIVGISDLIAIGAIKCLHKLGIRVPGDIAVAGYDNIALSTLITPQLTTVAEPVQELAYACVDLLVDDIKHLREKKKEIVLEGKLIVRESTAHK